MKLLFSKIKGFCFQKIYCQLFFIFCMTLFCSMQLNAQTTKTKTILFTELVLDSAKVGREIPLKKVDDLMNDLSKFRGPREAIDRELKSATNTIAEVSKSKRANEVLGFLRNSTSKLDPGLIKKIEQLDESSREMAVVLAKGGEEITKTVPDILVRGQLLRNGGAETVAAVGVFGSEAAKTALRLDEAIKAGSVVIKDGTRAITLSDFGFVLIREGNASWTFWNKYIQPNWKLWAGTGAMAAYLVNPEFFQDKLGAITKHGIKSITKLMGTLGEGFIKGLGEGVDDIGHSIWETIKNSVLNSIYAIIFFLILIIVILSYLFQRIKYWVLLPFRWLNAKPVDSALSKPHESQSESSSSI